MARLPVLITGGALLASAAFAQVVRIADTEPVAYGFFADSARTASGVLHASWRDGTSTVLRLTTSTDGGISWSEQTLPGIRARDNVRISASDPGIIDLVYSGSVDGEHLRSTDGGLSWSGPHALPNAVASSSTKHTRIATYTSGAIAIIDRPPSTSSIRTLVSSDGGLSFTGNLLVASGAYGNPALSWLSGTDLLACWASSGGGDGVVHCALSTDSGISFGATVDAFRITPTQETFPNLAERVPGEVLLAVSSTLTLQLTTSPDSGLTWSAAQTLATTAAPFNFSRPSISAGPAGEAWVATSSRQNGKYPNATYLFHTTDGTTWAPSPTLPLDLATCVNRVEEPRLHAGPSPGELYYRAAPGTGGWSSNAIGWQTLAAGATWSAPRGVGPLGNPTIDVRVVRLTSGRLAAFWLSGTVAPPTLFSSFSDDGGLTWSPKVAVSDLEISLRRETGKHSLGMSSSYPIPRFDVTTTASGGVVATWLSRTSDSCGSIRLSASSDGSSFAASVAVGADLDQFPLSIAEDGAAVLVTSWMFAGEVLSSRSVDGGLSWSPALAIATPTGKPLLPTEVNRIGDGSLGVSVVRDGKRMSTTEVEYFRSSDGGLSWTMTPVATLASNVEADQPALIDANLRAVIAFEIFYCAGFECYLDPRNYQSNDFGLSWAWFNGEIKSTPLAAAGAGGSIRWEVPIDATFENLPGGPPREQRDWLPTTSGAVESSLLYEGVGWGAMFADWESRTPPGVFYSSLPCPWPKFTALPNTLDVCPGAPFTLSLSFIPEPILTFQWYENGFAIPGETQPDLNWTAPPGGGSYNIRITNGCFTLSSRTQVRELAPPSFVTQPVPAAVCLGDPVSFRGIANLATSYQWQKNGLDIPGENTNTYTIASTTAADDAEYTLVATGGCGVATSQPATLSIREIPSIIDSPDDVRVCLGDAFALSVTATDATTYQWWKDGLPIVGATLSTYNDPAVTVLDEGLYSVAITGPCGAITSAPATAIIDEILAPLPTVLCAARRGAETAFTWINVATATSYELVTDLDPTGPYSTSVGTSLSGSPGIAIPYPPDDLRFYRLAGRNTCGLGSP